jgi:hypothetical protein
MEAVAAFGKPTSTSALPQHVLAIESGQISCGTVTGTGNTARQEAEQHAELIEK